MGEIHAIELRLSELNNKRGCFYNLLFSTASATWPPGIAQLSPASTQGKAEAEFGTQFPWLSIDCRELPK